MGLAKYFLFTSCGHFSWKRNWQYLFKMDESSAVATNQTQDQGTWTTSQPSFLNPRMKGSKVEREKLVIKYQGKMYPEISPRTVNAEGKNFQCIGKDVRMRLLMRVPEPTYEHSDMSTHIGPWAKRSGLGYQVCYCLFSVSQKSMF